MQGDADAIAAFGLCLQDEEDLVRAAAVDGLCKVSGTSSEHGKMVAQELLNHMDSAVRASAVEALRELADEDDAQVRELLASALDDSDELVREAASKALALLPGH